MILTRLAALILPTLTATQADLEKAIPEGSSIAVRVEAEIESCDCSMMCDTQFNDPVIFTRRNGKFLVVNPNSNPEDIGRPVLYEGEVKEGKFVGQREDTYTVSYLGLIHVKNRFSAELFDPEGQKIRGTLKVDITASPVEAFGVEVHEEFKKLYSVPCSVRASFSGERVEPLEFDIEKRVKIWNLLKTHVDFLMMRDPVGGMAPLLEGLEIEGDHRGEFLWRKSRAHYLAGESLPTDAEEERILAFEAGIQAARDALAINPESGEANQFLSANLGRRNTTIGKLKTAFGLEEFEAGCLKSIELETPYNMFGFTVLGDAHYALGQFYRLVPDSWFIELLLGARGDLKKAVEHMRKAQALQPTRGDYLKELGVALLCYGQEEEDEEAIAEAKVWLDRALKAKVYVYPPELEYDQIRRLSANPEDACGFSRDQY